jgi:electron transfer flavoprotein beta subunit
MDILVCMKQVPDTQKVKIDPERGTLIRKGVPSITNPFDESALELALDMREKSGGRVTVLSMGIPDAECLLRDALTLGADRAFLLTDREFSGADTLATSYTLSTAIRTIGSFDLLLFGKQAIDGDTAQVGPETAAHLGIPVVTFVSSVLSADRTAIVVERNVDGGKETVRAEFPAVLTVVKSLQRLRMPTLEGIIESFERPVARLGAGDIGADAGRCGLKGSPTRVKKVFTPSVHAKVRFLEGSAEEKALGLCEILADRNLIKDRNAPGERGVLRSVDGAEDRRGAPRRATDRGEEAG